MNSIHKKKTIVISAINFTEGGPLTIYQECMDSACKVIPEDWEIIALVNNKKKFNISRVTYIEFPKAKLSWFIRLIYEWFIFYNLSKKLKPDLWLSLHDITPLVNAKHQAVYCHNPSPFYKASFHEAILSPKFFIFTLTYKYVYKLFIRRNKYIIVQQEWIRDKFKMMFGNLPVIVAYPSLEKIVSAASYNKKNRKKIFLYPAYPRVFKNFEVVFEAVKELNDRGIYDFEVQMTLSGNENRYAKWLYQSYKHVKNINFIGLKNKIDLQRIYEKANVVIFPSKLETWGLPISEAKNLDKTLILADLPYAHETVGNYQMVKFFSPSDASQLADIMQSVIENNWKTVGAKRNEPMQPFVRNWDELWSMLINDL